MGNFGTSIKRFLSNKNTVTLLAIIVCTVLLYLFYNNRVNNAVRTTYVCSASQVIPARTVITEEMTSRTRVLTSQVSPNMITDCSQVVGMYASYATEIPENSFFYSSMIMKGEDMPDSTFDGIMDGYTLFKLPVSFESTYGNSIFPKNRIDLYIHTTDESGKLIYGKFIQSIEVLAVKDSEGRNVFETTVEVRTPSQLQFAVPDDLYLLLYKAQLLGIDIVVVPRNSNYTAKKGETLVSSEYLRTLIEDQTGSIPDECVPSVTGVAECTIPSEDDTNNIVNTETENNNTENNQG